MPHRAGHVVCFPYARACTNVYTLTLSPTPTYNRFLQYYSVFHETYIHSLVLYFLFLYGLSLSICVWCNFSFSFFCLFSSFSLFFLFSTYFFTCVRSLQSTLLLDTCLYVRAHTPAPPRDGDCSWRIQIIGVSEAAPNEREKLRRQIIFMGR